MKNMHNEALENTEQWESKELGADEEFVRVSSSDTSSNLDSNLNLKPISIRLQKDIIEKLKLIASEQGLGYQPLIRHIVTQYANSHTDNSSKLMME